MHIMVSIIMAKITYDFYISDQSMVWLLQL